MEIAAQEWFWTRKDAPFFERVFIGVNYLILAMVFLFLQLSILIIFLLYKDYRSHLCYRIMMVISFADSIQLIIHCYGGLITLFDNSFSTRMEKLLGGIQNSFCIILLPLGLILALNRLFIFRTKQLNPSTERRLFNLLILASFIWGGSFFCIYLTPHSGMAFRDYAWNYDHGNNETWEWVQMVDELTTIPFLLITLIIYIAILCIMISKRKLQTQSEGSSTGRRRILAAHELRLLIQSLIHFFLCSSLLIVWHLSFLLPDSAYSVAAVNYYWILYNGINPVLYLTMNSNNNTIRKRVVKLWTCKGAQVSTADTAFNAKTIVSKLQPSNRSVSAVTRANSRVMENQKF